MRWVSQVRTGRHRIIAIIKSHSRWAIDNRNRQTVWVPFLTRFNWRSRKANTYLEHVLLLLLFQLYLAVFNTRSPSLLESNVCIHCLCGTGDKHAQNNISQAINKLPDSAAVDVEETLWEEFDWLAVLVAVLNTAKLTVERWHVGEI